MNRRTLKDITQTVGPIANFVRKRRKLLGYTQVALSQRIGVGVRFLKELEQGKESLRLDKINEVLRFFGFTTGPIPLVRDNPFEEKNE